MLGTPARRDELVRGEYAWAVGEYGDDPVAVGIVDVLRQPLTGQCQGDEEWFAVAE